MLDLMVTPARQPDDDDLVGALIQERYRILRRLARGGMGAIYEAEHVRIGKRVAIKTLLPMFGDRPEMLLRFQREAKAASAIGHPGIVDVRDMGELPDGTPYMALELLEGLDWEARISEQGPQPIGSTVRLARRVCDALGAAHEAGIVHRDLKPANVFLVDDGEDIKLLDFGVARFRPDGVEEATLTRTGVALGTVRYMSPEQAKGAVVDHRTDLWALGVLLFHALTGDYPYDDASLPMLVVKICTEEPPRLAEHRRDIPEALEVVVRTLLARDRDERYQSCAEVSAALAPLADHDHPPDLRDDAPNRRRVEPSVLSGTRRRAVDGADPTLAAAPRRPTTPYLLLAALLLIAGGVTWWFGAGPGPAEDAAPTTGASPAGAPPEPREAPAPLRDGLEHTAEAPASAEDAEEPPPPQAAAPPEAVPAPPSTHHRTRRVEARRPGEASPRSTPGSAPADRGFRTTALSADEF